MIFKLEETSLEKQLKLLPTDLVLVDFYADWCEPCKWLDEILVNIDVELNGKASILKVNTEQFGAIRDQFNIRGIPVLAIFRKGELVWRMNGFLAENELLAKVLSYQ